MSLEVTTIETIEDVDRNQWNHVVDHAAVSSVYHRHGWLRAIEFGTDYEPRHILVLKKNNPIAIFPNFLVEDDRFLVSHLTSIEQGSGGPIATTEEERAIQLLLDEVEDVCDATVLSNQIQTRGQRYARYHGLFEENGYRQKLADCDFELDITREWETILSEMDSSRRRAIKQGHDNEFEIIDKAITAETMSTFYEGFQSVMKRVGGDIPPRQFFLELVNFSDQIKIFALHADGTERGSILLLLDDEQEIVHYQESAVEQAHFEYNASELLHEHAIKWGQENGYRTYDFGGTELDFRDGLYQFKAKFGARPVPALIWERGCSTPLWPVYRAGRYLYQ
ncbi:GNAT family N-acetyltransferase [Natronorubrum sulfidifaciens]|uniref:BioF2-like acetyltransferase domain-containing protein n=1 Tax=Natronorubrum sulfidifaciens JCM 14089 TaxID=1230460 RepID=L9VY54_9EURY|nr:GNAT family N-acetyltransferase [Natronorubrum sulfidifaciens]ELY42099.1 hypothetical protein C495_16163 [Natronorubrum sulfidifaciens JCM 14089]